MVNGHGKETEPPSLMRSGTSCAIMDREPEGGLMGTYKRPAGTIMNKIDVANNKETPGVLKMLDKKFYPPAGWDLKKKPFKPKRKSVRLSVPEGLAELAEFLGRAQGMTGSEFMATLLSEALVEAMSRVRRQPGGGRKKPAK